MKQEKMKNKNTGMHLQMMKDGYNVYCMITMIKIQYFEWLVHAWSL